jgi:hypothetical protein
MNSNTEKRYQCRHIFAGGQRCGSPALRHEPFCYYHHTTRRPAPRNRPAAPFDLDLPIPEDRAAIQSAIGQILQRIAANQLDPRRAGLLLYGLQIAASILPKPQKQAKSTRSRRNEDDKYILEPQFVDEIVDHPDHGHIAPEAPMPNPEDLRPKSLAGELLRALRTGKHLYELEDLDNNTGDDEDDDDDVPDEELEDFQQPNEDEQTNSNEVPDQDLPQTIPNLQACEDSSPDLKQINRRLCTKTTGGVLHRSDKNQLHQTHPAFIPLLSPFLFSAPCASKRKAKAQRIMDFASERK